jgi:hypothetical protein
MMQVCFVHFRVEKAPLGKEETGLGGFDRKAAASAFAAVVMARVRIVRGFDKSPIAAH